MKSFLRQAKTAAKRAVEGDDAERASAAVDTSREIQRQLVELETIYRTAPVGLAFVDTDLRYLHINERLATINGIPAASHVGRTIWEVLPEIADVVAPDYRAVIASGEPVIDKEVRGHTKADPNSEHVYLVSYYPVMDVPGRVAGVTAVVQDITVQKQIEEALRHSERRFSLFMQNLPGAAWMKDAEGRYVYANHEAERIFQARLDDLRGKTDQEIFPSEIANQFRANDLRAIEAGHGITTIETLPESDGLHHSIVSKFPIADAGEETARVGGVAFDVTEQRTAEEALHRAAEELQVTNEALLRSNQYLRAAQEQLQLVTNNMAAAVARCSCDLHYVWVSRSYAGWIGRPAEEIAGQPIRDVIGTEGYEDVLPFIRRALRGERVEYTTQVNFLDPGKRWIHAVYVPTFSPPGEVDGWIEVVTDVSDEKRITEQLREHAQLLDLTQDAILSLRWDGTIEFWNRGAEERYGWRRDEAIGQVAHELLRTEFPEALPAIQRKFARDGYWQGELTQTKPDGTKITVASRWAIRRGADDEPSGYLEIATDITDRKRAEEQMRQTQRLESLGILAGGIAHDFNNLLVVILGNASLALNVLGTGSPAKEMLEDLIGSSERAAGLTRQLLTYAGKEQLAIRPINISNLVREIMRLLNASLRKTVHVALDLQDSVPSVNADATQLQQVIMNLVINAAEAIPENTAGTVKITTAYRKPSIEDCAAAIVPLQDEKRDYVVLQIADTGPGIPSGIRSRIFDPFFTTKFAGRGLGLSAVIGIVKAHNGAIALTTAPGMGTTFTVLLPPGHARVHDQAPVAPPPVRGSGTILVIDDEPAVRTMAQRALEHYGYNVFVAENGRQGIDLLAEHPEVVAVILDLAMPVLTGDQAIPYLRRLRPALPIILSSGYSEKDARARFAEAGIASFLQKPYKAATLLEAVSASLDRPNQHSNDT